MKDAKFMRDFLVFVPNLFHSMRNKWREDPDGKFKRKVIAALALFFMLAGVQYYLSRHKGARFGVTGTSPGPTQLKEDAKPEPVHVYFGGSAARLEQIGRSVEKGVSIHPAIKGEWRWATDRMLTFTPGEDWAVGQDYVVHMDRTLFPEYVKLETYKYQFKSAAFTAAISQSEFYQDPRKPKLKKVVVTVKFSHPVDTTEFESRVKMYMGGRRGGFLGLGQSVYPFTIAYDKFKGEAYIHSDTVAIPQDDTFMEIAVEAGVRAARRGPATGNEMSQKVVIPGMFNFFRIQSANLTLVRNERYEPEQVLVIETTAGALEENIQKNLEVYLLPPHLAAKPGQAAVQDYHWTDPARVGPEELALSTRVNLEPIPTDKEYATLHSFKYQAEVGRYLYVRLRKGIESWGGYILAKEFNAAMAVPQFPKELNIMQDGAILSLSGDKKLPVVARGIEAIRYQIGRVVPGQINHMVTQSAGQFRAPNFYYNFGEENITERFENFVTLPHLGPAKTQYSALDLGQYLGEGSRRGLFFIEAQGWDPIRRQPAGPSDRRLILITDLGILAKDNRDGSHDVFIQSIQGGHPVSAARVEVLGKNGIAITGETTGENGHVRLPTLNDFTREKQPTVYIVRKGDDLSFLPYNWSDRRLNLSRFDVGGVYQQGSGDGIQAYLFSDRGIYRPGDEIRVGMIVKPADWKQSLAGIPLELAVRDARGMEVYKRKFSLAASGFEEFKHPTEEVSPTGQWEVQLYIVKDGHRHNLLGSTAIRVEEFLPDRMRITTALSRERLDGWVSPEDMKGLVTLKNLFGTPAENRRVTGMITLLPAYPQFRKYQDYHFYDPLRAKNSFTERLPETQTNADGEAEFPLGLEKFEKATYHLRFTAEGFESEGGRGVTSESSVLVSPMKFLIGSKPDGDFRYIKKQSEHTAEMIAIDAELNRVSAPGLKAHFYELRFVSVLKQQSNLTYQYESIQREVLRTKKDISIAPEGLRILIPTDAPGDFALVIKDEDGLELNRVPFTVIGEANLTRTLEKNAELQVSVDKTDYEPGEWVELQIKAPYTGAGVITIEQDKVYAYQWFRADTNTTVHRIQLPSSIEGNGYINVAFVRALHSREIFMSPLSYGVVPFSISRKKRTNPVALTTPDVARPGEPFTILYKTDKPGKIVIFAVDEGILQVAGYKTPDPLSHFFRKRALEVQTFQILDLILPEFSIVQALSSIGGDAGHEALGKNLNPFRRKRDKPVAYWSGILDSDSTERQAVYEVPDYFNGALRVMAVAVSPDSIGVAEKKSIVRGHFVLTPNVPTFVAPGDEFIVSVGVANNAEGSGKNAAIILELKTSEHLEVIEKPSLELSISEGREKSVSFRIRTKDKPGSANLTFWASHAGKRSKTSIDLSVRPPIPYITTVQGGHTKTGAVSVKVSRKMYPHYRILEVAASLVPLGLARGLIHYLDRFPYGCTEQIVSQAMPAIILQKRPEFGYSPEKVEASLTHAVRVLLTRQNGDGAFGFWAANSHFSDVQSVYAMHFLTEASDRGYPVPADLIQRGRRFLVSLAQSEAGSLPEARVRAYANYILARGGLRPTSYVASLHAKLKGEGKTWNWDKDLTAVYLAATYQMLQMSSEASRLISKMSLGDPQSSDYNNYYDGLTRDAQLLFVLAKHFPGRLKALSGEDILHVANPLLQGSFNTMTAAYAILALDAYASAVEHRSPGDLTISEILPGGKPKPLTLPMGLFPRVDFSPEAEGVRIHNRSPHLLFYQVVQAGFDRADPQAALKRNLEIQREYCNENNKTIGSVPLGSEAWVHIKVRVIEGGDMRNIAVVDLLPGGFEPVLDPGVRGGNEDGDGGGAAAWRPDYVDIREDRVVIYGTAGSSVQEFVYRIKATNKGQYKAPPAFGESMYDRSAQALSLASKITVE